jgi:hypothetical protein
MGWLTGAKVTGGGVAKKSKVSHPTRVTQEQNENRERKDFKFFS